MCRARAPRRHVGLPGRDSVASPAGSTLLCVVSSWGLALVVPCLYPLIAAVGSTRDLVLYGELAPLAQCAIVRSTFAYGNTDALARLVPYDDLRLLGRAFLLPARVWPLFFGGLSTGFSATSTTIPAQGVPPVRHCFLPGIWHV